MARSWARCDWVPNWSDIRGYTVRPGVYTLRFALQPQNGDHMGISPNREFLLPAPAADDLTLDPVGYDGAVALARKTSRRAHPGRNQHRPANQPGAAPVSSDQRPRPPGRHCERPYVGRRAHLRPRRRRHYRSLATERSERICHRGTEPTEVCRGSLWLNYQHGSERARRSHHRRKAHRRRSGDRSRPGGRRHRARVPPVPRRGRGDGDRGACGRTTGCCDPGRSVEGG